MDGISRFSPQSVFLAFALAGGTVFVLRAVSLLLGFGGDDAGADDAGAAGAPDASPDADGTPGGDFRLFTVNGIVSFAFLFGLTGWLLLRDGAASVTVASVAAVAVGALSMWVTGKIFHATRKLQTDGTVRLSDAVGQSGEVYLSVRPGETGQVRVTARGQSKIFDARAADPLASLPTGAPVKVVSESGGVLVVEKL